MSELSKKRRVCGEKLEKGKLKVGAKISAVKVLVTYAMKEKYFRSLQASFPEVEVVKAADEGNILEGVVDADVVYAGRFNGKIFKAAKELRWVQSRGTGVDRFCRIPGFVDSRVILTNSKGVHVIPVSEHVFAFMLSVTRKLKHFFEAQKSKRWARTGLGELYGQTLGIMGVGNIGSELARKGKCFGMRVLATRRRTELKSEHVDELIPQKELDHLFGESDFIVVCLPLTGETRGLIGGELLRKMKKTAWIINIGRGSIIQEKALVKHLKENSIEGAALDVFEEEPLPSSSELWTLPNAIITPHIAGHSPKGEERSFRIFIDNLGRFLEGQPMINVVDKKEGY
ncbi:MAG: D-2-hydroxyacid dehydrogenase [Candidatus Bathyarchaeota archaeon]|nr:D-2-hydroxyacid dehydrogenase [Candidatus Bathyarchaeota archaeon]